MDVSVSVLEFLELGEAGRLKFKDLFHALAKALLLLSVEDLILLEEYFLEKKLDPWVPPLLALDADESPDQKLAEYDPQLPPGKPEDIILV